MVLEIRGRTAVVSRGVAYICNNVVFSQAYTSTYMQNHNDTRNKQRSEDFFKKIHLSLYCKVRKGLLSVYCERELETEQNCNILTPTLLAISVVSFPFSRAAQPEDQRPTLLGAGFLYRILSPTGLQTPSGIPRAPSAGCGFPYHISSLTSLVPYSLTSCLHRVI